MPAIPQYFLDGVVYLYKDEQSAREGKEFGGSGFLISVPSKTHMNHPHTYVVSNWHVAVRDGFSVVRINTTEGDGGTDVITFDSSDWEFIPDGGDVAVASIELRQGFHKVRCLDPTDFLVRGWEHFFEIGEDVFMLGRFIDLGGEQTNQPAARFGNISVRPTHLDDTANGDAATRYYLLDMHSRTGFSGSPVFAYRTMGSVIGQKLGGKIFHDRDGGVERIELPIHEPIVKLLGIHCGQFTDEMTVESPSGKSVLVGPSGMTFALPTSRIVDVLNCAKFVERRKAADLKIKHENLVLRPETSWTI